MDPCCWFLLVRQRRKRLPYVADRQDSFKDGKAPSAVALNRDRPLADEPYRPTKEETLEKADEAGLVDTVKDKPVLVDDLTIRRRAPDPEHKSEEDLDWRLTSTDLTSTDLLFGHFIYTTPAVTPDRHQAPDRCKKRRPQARKKTQAAAFQLADGTSASAVGRKPATSLLVPELRLVGCTHLPAIMIAETSLEGSAQ